MTQDEIIEMYLQVSKELCNDTEWCWAGVGEPLQMFAELVAAKASAQRTWVGLTNEEIGDEYVRFEVSKGGFNRFEYAVKAIEAKLKEKNT
tara:strand:- start:548 stop:820 length:273 start_codon:yes stop_codon:yes gene_type:complete